ncbi:hypothetical protein FB45DRAFT_906631 [Roridomyces roridus]|uniref:F-box domain-containing protein n=1 Tax=Roridomyces roridus TaxID=1738132 RepID=A0AAD7C2Z0_9AGAR|nr:hypothetical protein FB45DRAFT_906631 [Roridomyces roridus]
MSSPSTASSQSSAGDDFAPLPAELAPGPSGQPTFWAFLRDEGDPELRPSLLTNESSGGCKRRMTYVRRTPSQALAAEQREISISDATRKRDQSFSLIGTANCPIQKLPVELLHAIFIACLPSDEYVPISSRLAPLVVSWVCKYWRRLALGFPALWTSLALECGAGTLQGHCDYLSFASKVWLARAGRRPLSLSLRSRVIWNKDLIGIEHDYTSFLTIEGFMHTCTTLDLGLAITAAQFNTLMDHGFVLVSATFSSVAPSPAYGSEELDEQPIEVEHLKTLEITTPAAPCASLLSRLVLPALKSLRLTDGGPPPLAWAAAASLAERSSAVTGTLELKEFSYTYKCIHRLVLGGSDPTAAHHIANALCDLVSHPSMQNLRRLSLRATPAHSSSSALDADWSSFSLNPLALAPFAEPGTLPRLRELVLGTCVAPDGVLSDVIRTRVEGFLGVARPSTDEHEQEEEEPAEGRCVRLRKLEVTFPSSMGFGFGLGGFHGYDHDLSRSRYRYERDRGMLATLADEVGFELVIKGGTETGEA